MTWTHSILLTSFQDPFSTWPLLRKAFFLVFFWRQNGARPKPPQNTPWGPRVLSRCISDFYRFPQFHVLVQFFPDFHRSQSFQGHSSVQRTTDFSKNVFVVVEWGEIQNSARTWKRGLNNPVGPTKTPHSVEMLRLKFRTSSGAQQLQSPFVIWIEPAQENLFFKIRSELAQGEFSFHLSTVC